MPRGIEDLGDGGDETRSFSERAHTEVGVSAPEQNPPVIDTSGGVKRFTGDSLVSQLNTSFGGPDVQPGHGNSTSCNDRFPRHACLVSISAFVIRWVGERKPDAMKGAPMRTSATDIDFATLAARATGAVVTPDDAAYDEERKLFPGDLDRHPTAMVRVVDSADVAAAIDFATTAGVEFTVRSGGHSPLGAGVVDDGLVIDVRDLDNIDIDTDARTAWVGSGVTAADFTTAAGEHGLVLGFGDTGSVGVGGITLGGGVGFLARKFGLTIDSLLAAEIVTASGEVLITDADNHPDLFWAVRGGGGNFGVVTRFHFELQPLERIVGGIMILPATPDTIAGFLAESANAPDELSTMANVMAAPPMPFLPEELIGTTVLLGFLTWAGDLEEGHRVIDRFRSLAEPLADFMREMPYSGMFPPEEGEYRPTAVALTGFSDDVSPQRIDQILGAVAASDAPMRAVQLRVLGGAVSRVPNEATAYAHRDRAMMVNVASFYEDQSTRQNRSDWVRDLHGYLTDGDAGYIGFLADEGEQRTKAAYPHGAWERLSEIKAIYDPGNIFHHNQNIPPAN
jgi:FAD binding domain/Berberine and berberine like